MTSLLRRNIFVSKVCLMVAIEKGMLGYADQTAAVGNRPSSCGQFVLCPTSPAPRQSNLAKNNRARWIRAYFGLGFFFGIWACSTH